MDDESRLAQLIVKQVCGTISAEEKLELDKWVAESPDHQWFMENRMRKEILDASALRLLEIDRAAIRKRIDELIEGKRMFPHRRLPSIGNIVKYGIAVAAIASIVLIPSIRHKRSHPANSSNFTSYRTQSILDTIAKQEKIKVERMTLTLSNGANIAIDDSPTPKYESGYRIINEGEGYVAYIRYTSNSNPATSQRMYNILTTAPDARPYILLMPDGSISDISPGTSLRYPVVPNEANGARIVTLHGEAVIDISTNPNAPFIVESQRVEAQALGTAIKIRDYGTEDSAKVIALSGKVEVGDEKGKTVLSQGEGVIIGESFPTLKFYPEVISIPELIRKSGMFNFTNRTSGSIMREISRWYAMDEPQFLDVDSSLQGKLGAGLLSKSLPLDSLLDIISTEHIHFDISGRSILVHK